MLQNSPSDDVLSKCDVIVSGVGVDEDVVYSKSTALQVCFRDYVKEFHSNTLILYFLTNPCEFFCFRRGYLGMS